MDTAQHKTVLVVEDDRQLADTLKSFLELDKFHVVVLYGGREAIEKIQTGPAPDVVLLDIMMPEVDGFTVLKAIRTNESTKKTPVVIFTALADAATLKTANALGATWVFVKAQMSPAELAPAIKRVLKGMES